MALLWMSTSHESDSDYGDEGRPLGSLSHLRGSDEEVEMLLIGLGLL